MNPDNQPSSNPVQTPPAWYAEANGGSSPPPKQPHHKQLFILAWATAAVMVVVGGLLLYFNLTAIKCLTAADYQTITGQPSDDTLAPKENFYTGSVTFKERSNEYSSDDQLEIIQKLGNFQASHSQVSIRVTLSASYAPFEGEALAIKRLDELKASVIQAGISEESITINKPVGYTPESDLTVTSTPAQYSITSASECQ